jgi:hypothetical protein
LQTAVLPWRRSTRQSRGQTRQDASAASASAARRSSSSTPSRRYAGRPSTRT